MLREFKFDQKVKSNFSEATIKTAIVFPKLLSGMEDLLRNYHEDNPAGLVERSDLPLNNFNVSGRLIATMLLTKVIYYSRTKSPGRVSVDASSHRGHCRRQAYARKTGAPDS
jgi:hypothetical protein